MKQIALSALFGYGLSYFMFAFTLALINPADWNRIDRGGMVTLGLFFTIVSFVIMKITEEEKK